MKQLEAQTEGRMVQHWDGEEGFFYAFHFTIEQALDTGGVQGDARKSAE
jgi:hypothetical protein